MSERKLSTPHDKFFHSAMTKLEVAKEFLKQHLPSKIQSIIDINSLQYEDTTYVDSELRKQIVDMLYSVDFEGEQGYIYILVEHQSSVEKMMPLRLLKYMIKIMEAHINKACDKNLPIIYPLIFYTGDKNYYASTDLFDLFGRKKDLAKSILFKPYQLVDVNKIPDKELIREFVLSGIMAKTMKHIRESNCFSLIKEDIKIIENKDLFEYNRTIITYIFEAGNIPEKEEFIKTIADFSEEMGEKVMSSYVTLKQQCMEEGRMEGRMEAMKTVLLRLLENGMDIVQASNITGLPLNEIEAIKSYSS